MKAPHGRPSRGFWIWGFTFLFLLHAFAVFWFGERRTPAPLWQKPAAFLFVSTDSAMDRQLAESIALRDPTLFALPHRHGFSGGAWQRLPPFVPRFTNWSAAPEWIALPSDEPGNSLGQYLATNRPSDESLLSSLRVAENPEVRIPDVPVIAETTVNVEGPLQKRKLLRVPALPPAVSASLLAQTVLTVAVNGDGIVQTAAIASPSGSRPADVQAVEYARQFEFEPLPIGDARAREQAAPTLGRLIFTWQVVLPTNAAASAGVL